MKSRISKGTKCLVLLSVFLWSFPIMAQNEETQALKQLQNFNKAFTHIARQITPTVVTISTKQTVVRTEMGRRTFPFQPFFQEPGRRHPKGHEEERDGLGSGIVITQDGYILTNHHVAGKADQITVIFSDNREFEAELVGADSLTDVAVIKIDAKGLPSAKIGNSDHLEIGEWVLAVGAPMDLRSTVTSGIVSALGRNLDIIADRTGFAIEDFIQTDAAINPGNSGGALVNLKGELVGVNTAIATSNRGFVGYGFAIPINLAKKVMDDIVAHGRVRRGFLGVGLEKVTAGIADAFGLDRPRGVLIATVYTETPAEAAGLRVEDIVLKVDNREVNRPNQIQSLIARKHPDDIVHLEVRRKGKTLNLKAKLGEQIGDFSSASASPPTPGKSEHYGLTIQSITPEIIESFGLDSEVEGVIVANTEVRSPARNAQFRVHDIIFKVRQGNIERDIGSVEDFDAALEQLEKGRNAAFSVRRGRSRIFLTMKIPL
jgi:serine protease Do